MSEWFLTYGFADVYDCLIIGAYPLDGDDVHALAHMTVRRILNLVEDEEYEPGRRLLIEQELAAAGIEEHRMRLTDFGRLPADLLEDAVQRVVSWLDDEGLIYMHCRAGWQRSAAVAAGVVAIREGMGIEDAMAYVQQRKPTASPLPHQLEDLQAWWQAREARAR
ncbi:MAG: dual specificity protein phosphatase family protein [Solirubrobacteraceae bacterium]